MPEFLSYNGGKPKIRLLLPYEVTQNPEVLAAAIQYLQHYAQIHLTAILIHAPLVERGGPSSQAAVQQHGLQNVFINSTTANKDGGGTFRLPIQGFQQSVLLSQRRIALDFQDRKQRPSGYEFAQACGNDDLFRPVSDARARSMEMSSGLSQSPLGLDRASVSHFLDAIAHARHAQRVTLEQLLAPKKTGNLLRVY